MLQKSTIRKEKQTAIALLSSDRMSDRQTGCHLTLPRLCDLDIILAILQKKRQAVGSFS